ncbi:hypothetical protein [Thalassotalea fusca]
MKTESLSLALILILVCACSSSRISSPSNYESKISHFLSLEENISLTSLFTLPGQEYGRSNLFTKENAIKILSVEKEWIKSNFYVERRIKDCFDSEIFNWNSIDRIFADKLLPRNEYLFNVYILDRKSFSFNSRLSDNQELDIYFALDECNKDGAANTFKTIRNQLVHELSHLILHSQKTPIKISDRKEEEYAHTLEVCNTINSAAFTGLNFSQDFNRNYSIDIYKARNIDFQNAEKLSELGKIDAHIRAQDISESIIAYEIDKELFTNEFKARFCEPVIKIYHID